MLALLLTAAVACQAERPTAATVHPYEIEARHDRVRDYTATALRIGDVDAREDDDPSAARSLRFAHVSAGETRRPLDDTSRVGATFYRVGKERVLDDHHSVSILADAFRARPDEEYEAERLEGGRVMESVSWTMTFGEFRRMTAAPDVELAVGTLDVRLTPRQVAALRDLAARLAVDSKAADELAFEHVTLLRKREAELHEAMEKAAEKAKAEVAKLPPSRRAREGNAVGLKITLAEFAPTSAKYEVTKEESRRLAEAFPIIGEAIMELQGRPR